MCVKTTKLRTRSDDLVLNLITLTLSLVFFRVPLRHDIDKGRKPQRVGLLGIYAVIKRTLFRLKIFIVFPVWR